MDKADLRKEIISIVVPAFNEEARILSSLKALARFCDAHFQHYEIVCVDDGSTDNTWDLITGVKEIPFIRPLRLLKNQGKGHAVKHGMLNARGEFRFFTDADLPYHPEAFEDALRAFDAHACDIVSGDRNLTESIAGVKVYSVRRIAGRIFSAIVNRLIRIDASDTQCGFKGFTANAAVEIFSQLEICGYAFDVEIFALAQQLRLKVCRVPVTLIKQAGSKIRLIRDPFWMVIDLLRIAWKERRPKDP